MSTYLPVSIIRERARLGYEIDVDELIDEIERLQLALEEYGYHYNTCPIYSNVRKPCTCGYTDAVTVKVTGPQDEGGND
jgi:hypothetical protein